MPYKSKEENSQYQRERRAKMKANGTPVSRGSDKRQSCPHATRYDNRQFIAWDGEGINLESRTDDEGRTWTAHNFTLFAASTGEYIEGNRLKTLDCLKLFLDVKAKYPDAIHVMFAGNYDATHILRDIPREKLLDMEKQPAGFLWRGFHIRYIPRKSLWIKRRRDNLSITIFDTFGFFQAKFADVVETWLGKDYPAYDAIVKGKNLRDIFNTQSPDYIREYNQHELDALVLIMQEFDRCMKALDLNLGQWHGAGAISAAMLKKHKMKDHLGEIPKEVELAARYAYFGGRFEQGLYGYGNQTIHFHDIISAYPSRLVKLPSLANGVWRFSKKPKIQGFGIYKVTWNVPGLRFGPFGFRVQNSVYYPTRGTNWVWGYELIAFLKWADTTTLPVMLNIHSGTWFDEKSPVRPFAWVGEYYQLRQQIKNGETDYPEGSQMPIKLGINSVYGKLAQRKGWMNDVPPFYSIIYAGAVTAGTRAILWSAAMQKPDSVVMLATDGIFTTEKLDLPFSTTNELGKWEYNTGQSILSVQSGIYTSLKDNGNWMIQSRGIDKKAKNEEGLYDFIQNFNERIISAHKKGKSTVTFSAKRLVSLRVGKQETQYQNIGNWVEAERVIKIAPLQEDLGKREREYNHDNSPWHRLEPTVPNRRIEEHLHKTTSRPFEREWDGREADAAFLEEELELWDTDW